MEVAAAAAALGGGFLFALAAVLQQREAYAVQDAPLMDTGLLWRLAHRPRWLAGVAADIASAALHVLALSLGSVALVQPLGVTGLVFAVPLAALVHHRRVRPADALAAVAVLVGLAMVLSVLGAAPAVGDVSQATLLALGAAGVALVGAVVVAAPRLAARVLAPVLAGAAGTAFGVTAVLLSAALGELERPDAGRHVTPLVLLVVLLVPAGYLVLQTAYRTGHFASALAVAIVADPLVAIVVAAVALHQRLPTGAGPLALLVTGAGIVVAALVALITSPAHLLDPVP